MAGVDCPEPPAPGGGDCAALRVGGVDGVAGGWVMAVTGASPGDPVEGIHVWSSFGELWAHAQQWGLGAVAVDIPIGLPGEDGRTCDREARARLKGNPGHTSSVFPAPPYCVTEARNWEEASRLARDRTGKGLTRQSFALLPKIRDVRCAVESCNLNRSVLPWLVEVHPEVSFREMAGVPMRFHKSLQAGIAERLAVLQLDFSNIVDAAVRTQRVGPPHPGIDDLLDAVAAAWTARRLVSGRAECLGEGDKDPEDYPMNIWV